MKIVKTKMNSTVRKLSVRYITEVEQELEHILAAEVKKELDREIMHAINKPLLLKQGWKCIMMRNESWEAVSSDWIKENIIGRYSCYGYYWYFEQESDASIFALRWS